MANEFSQENPIQFFKIICDQNLHQQKLMMPTKFVEKYGNFLPKAIYLETPNGEKWELNLVKSEGKIWFEKGWNEFEEYHSLSHGHLLVFKYEQISHFKVHIFDKTTLEITYPFKRVDAQRVSNEEDLEDHKESRKTGKELVIVKKATALERAISFKACNPSFHIIMRPSYINSHANLNIPKEFGKKYLKDLDAKNGDIHLRLLNGRVWPAKYQRKVFIDKEKFVVTSKGWKTFRKDNNLKVGDVCTFELFPTSTPLTFLVHIFRDSFET